MVRFLNRIATRMLILAAVMTAITMIVGLGAYYTAMYYRLDTMERHMPPKARARLEQLVSNNQRGTDEYYELYDRYGGDALNLSDYRFIGIIALISTIAGGGVAVILARRISQPITAVARAAAQVSAGDRTARVRRGRTSGETGELVDSFNRMAAEIEAYERERTVLTAGIAHELRTPLTILKGRLHGLIDGVIAPETGEADRLLRQVEHLSRIVEDLRTLAHADVGELGLDLRSIDLGTVARSTINDLRPLADETGIVLRGSYQRAYVAGDSVRLIQIFTNLLTNAIKHAPPASEVAIAMTVSGSHVVVQVTDEGKGFRPEDKDRLFIPFWRAGADRLAGRPGSGIGLTLASKLAEAHGGRIEASNREDRSGACFAVWLPLKSV
jgi:signal transduction histidine kinase